MRVAQQNAMKLRYGRKTRRGRRNSLTEMLFYR
jgi:hypothetical protein